MPHQLPLNKINQESYFKRRMVYLECKTLRIDPPLFVFIFLLAATGLLILFSASNQNMGMMLKQTIWLFLGFTILFIFAYISPKCYQQWTPWIFFVGLLLLIALLIFGNVNKGSRRWFDLGFFHLQPSEIMKLAMPMMLAHYFSDKELPPKAISLMVSLFLLALPVILTAKQPDLGTAIIIAVSGLCVLLLVGLNWQLICTFLSIGALSMPILWHFMHTYQKERVLTFLNPERDSLGSGYHIIQSEIALGSGGLFGKGWLHGTQSHLQFLPAHTTDFIFAVDGEELGFIGCLILLAILFAIFIRCFYITSRAQDTFTRLLSGSLSLTFIFSAFVNIGMVIGILPVVGVPLPLISYGGSSIITTMAGFGVIMSIHTHRKLWSS
ncbi:rod shape-determining protein RodA [Coxiella endosymbiont of Amblyomma nuttalli]|uniref:rod shape-determining protein RodA n=1 Tax=Coxiella endosymbiont of Amblyomma nuttalli TaxID=2749996 RepID=UPI001BB6C290|nr:rod shape-determining protein RodA [Coxiella endosymbiont of Amblyomma nuttalli]QTS83882.1 Peptidoglycan glycosyltransferase [Coxiella endosymbiont of Amblyomma nuttalli]